MITPVVEGEGEVAAVPLLLRRLVQEMGVYVEIRRPIRKSRSQLVRENDFKQAIRLASLDSGTRAVLVLFDSDDDCARDIVPRLRRFAEQENVRLPCAVVLARREYEAWFLSAVESLRGIRGIASDAAYAKNPEAKRGAKEELRAFMPRNAPYSESADQAALTAHVDLAQAYRRSSSFRKLVKELIGLLAVLGHQPTLPEAWSEDLPESE